MSLDEAVDFYHAQVWTDTPASFLLERSLLHSTVDRFRLGYVGVPASGDRKRAGCLVLPYEDGLGRVRSVRYRPLYPSEAKYLSVKDDKAHVFAVRATDNPTVYVCEGEIDAMTLWQVGLRAAGIPGATAWKDEWRWLFRNAERVVLCFDPDDAGIRAASRIWQSLSVVTDVDVVRFPPGLDVNDVYRRFGPDALREMVA